jgi:hypothetical protein
LWKRLKGQRALESSIKPVFRQGWSGVIFFFSIIIFCSLHCLMLLIWTLCCFIIMCFNYMYFYTTCIVSILPVVCSFATRILLVWTWNDCIVSILPVVCSFATRDTTNLDLEWLWRHKLSSKHNAMRFTSFSHPHYLRLRCRYTKQMSKPNHHFY